MSQSEAIKVIGDILSEELGLINSGPNSQIMLTNERFNIPVNNNLYIALSYISGKPIGNNNYFDGNTLIETQQVVMLYDIQIDIMSYGPAARQQKEQIYQALRSVYAQQQMEINNIQLARMPAAFVDASSLEESKMLNRYTITIKLSALLTNTRTLSTDYDSFPFEYIENSSAAFSPELQPEEPFQ